MLACPSLTSETAFFFDPVPWCSHGGRWGPVGPFPAVPGSHSWAPWTPWAAATASSTEIAIPQQMGEDLKGHKDIVPASKRGVEVGFLELIDGIYYSSSM